MGADNWAICPKCQKTAEEKQEKLKTKIEESYGKVSREEYAAMVEKFGDVEILLDSPSNEARTLSEYYELGIVGDVFEISYHAHCKACEFDKKYDHIETLEL